MKTKPRIHWRLHGREIIFMILMGFILGNLSGMIIAYNNGLIRNRNMSKMYSELRSLRTEVPKLREQNKELWQ